MDSKWLAQYLAPDYETIADPRQGECFTIKPTFTDAWSIIAERARHYEYEDEFPNIRLRWRGRRMIPGYGKVSRSPRFEELMQIINVYRKEAVKQHERMTLAARKIQKAYALWSWRRKTLWDPWSEDGRAHLMVTARIACVEVSGECLP